MNNYYIYIYLDPRKYGRYLYENFSFLYKPIYVGKGKNDRYLVEYGRRKDFTNIINEIKELELEPIKIKLYENLSEEESFELETKMINEIGRIDLGTGYLINKTSGGQGSSGRIVLEETLKKYKKYFQEIKNEFEKRNYILLTEENEYKNSKKTKLNYICPEGHKGSINWNSFQQDQGCLICGCGIGHDKIKKNFSEIKNEFEKRNYILLSEEKDYKNAFTKLKYICPNGHKGSINWLNFQQEHGCPICYNELRSDKMKGKNSILIIQDIVQIKLLLKEGKLIQKEIADIFEVDEVVISNIKTEKFWSYIKI